MHLDQQPVRRIDLLSGRIQKWVGDGHAIPLSQIVFGLSAFLIPLAAYFRAIAVPLIPPVLPAA